MDPIAIKALLKALVLPPGGPLFLALAGLLIMTVRPRAGRLLAFAGVLALLTLSMPPVSVTLQRAVYDSEPFDIVHARDAAAIVVLGGGVRSDAPEYGGDTLATLTLERVRYAARIARLTKLPVLVSGGSVFGASAEAPLMRATLENEFGVPVRWIEDRSRTTHENAVDSAEILKREKVTRVLLVAHAFDMPRATAEFAAAGIHAIPVPIGLSRWHAESPADFLPSMSALTGSYYALYEIAGEAVRRLSVAFSNKR